MFTVNMHTPTNAVSNEFESGTRVVGSLRFICDDGGFITIFTTPQVARAVADAFNEAIAATAEGETS